MTQYTVEFLHEVIQVILKLLRLKPSDYSFTQFLYCKEPLTGNISATENFCIIVNSAGGNFCWNFVTDTLYNNYADDNV